MTPDHIDPETGLGDADALAVADALRRLAEAIMHGHVEDIVLAYTPVSDADAQLLISWNNPPRVVELAEAIMQKVSPRAALGISLQ